MQKTFYTIFITAFLLADIAHANNNWAWTCESEKVACQKVCDLNQRNEFNPMKHHKLVIECAPDKQDSGNEKVTSDQ